MDASALRSLRALRGGLLTRTELGTRVCKVHQQRLRHALLVHDDLPCRHAVAEECGRGARQGVGRHEPIVAGARSGRAQRAIDMDGTLKRRDRR